MKPDAHKQIDKYRITSGRLASDSSFGNNGAFMVPYRGVVLNIIVSDGGGWDHVSVSLPTRCPSWKEMCWVKDLFFEPFEAAMQLHPAKSDYVNYHEYCLHLWRPHDKRIPLPPTEFVGPLMAE